MNSVWCLYLWIPRWCLYDDVLLIVSDKLCQSKHLVKSYTACLKKQLFTWLLIYTKLKTIYRRSITKTHNRLRTENFFLGQRRHLGLLYSWPDQLTHAAPALNSTFLTTSKILMRYGLWSVVSAVIFRKQAKRLAIYRAHSQAHKIPTQKRTT